MAALTAQAPSLAGTNPTYNTCNAGGDTVPCGDGTYLHFKTTGTVAVVTIGSYPDVDPGTGVAIPDATVTLPATGERIVGPLRGSSFANPADGRAYLTYSSVVGLSVAVVKVN